MPSLRKLKKIFAHERRRDKEMELRAKQTEQLKDDIASGKVIVQPQKSPIHVSGMPSQEQLESIGMEVAGLSSRAPTQDNIRQACLAMNDLVHRQGNGQSRKQVLVHLPGEIRQVMMGRTSQETFDYYWSLPEFKAVWAHLQFTEQSLKDFVNAQAKQVGKDLLT